MPFLWTDPNIAFLLLIAGTLGLLWELHAPGIIVPGALGAVLFCAGAFGIWQDAPTWYGSALIAFAILLLGIELKVGSHGASGVAGAVLLSVGAMALVQTPHRIDPALAFGISMAAGMIAASLGYLGLRARSALPRTGREVLIGETGISRTEIQPQGTVFVRGEYWQARSSAAVPAGARVVIEGVQGLLLFVKEV